MHYLQFLDPTADPALALPSTYDPTLVTVSVLMASLAAYAALGLAGRIKAAENRRTKQLWLGAGATAMGIGIWAMHFIGMLAFRLPIAVAYNLGITLLSVAPAVVASSIVLYVTSRAEIRFSQLALAGTMMGLGIGAMHYTGMAAMRMAADMYYDRLLFGVSLIVAVGLATAALYIHFLASEGGEQQSPLLRFAAAFTMGSAVAGMHYTAMAAAYFFPSGGQGLSAGALDPTVLAMLVGLAAAVIMAFAIFVVVIDTRLKAAAYSVRTSQAHLMHAIESVSEGFSLYDAQDRLVLCNKKYRELFHHADKDVIGEAFENMIRRLVERGLILLADRGAEDWIAQRLAQHRNPSGPHTQERSDGRWLQINERKTEDGGTVAIYTDITAPKEAEQALRKVNVELQASNKELNAFAYSVSHDLRAPVRALDGFSAALLQDHGEKLNEEGKDMLRRVRKASGHLAALIDAMLTLSRLTRREMRVERVNLSVLAQSVADSLRAAEPRRQASILLPAELEARGDRELLRVVLENLLGNAWKFTSEQPQAQIEFGVAQVDGERAYFVRDDGAGFDMAYADKLFSPFQRLHRQEEFPGSGIGLATVERIVHRHGGRVWAEGAVNKGATFFFTL